MLAFSTALRTVFENFGRETSVPLFAILVPYRELGRSFDLSLRIGVFSKYSEEYFILASGALQAIFLVGASFSIRTVELDAIWRIASYVGDRSGIYVFVIVETLLIFVSFQIWKVMNMPEYGTAVFLLFVIANFAIIWVCV